MYLCLIITIDCERSTLLITVNNGNPSAHLCISLLLLVNCHISLLFPWDLRWFSMFNIFPQPRSHTKMANSSIALSLTNKGKTHSTPPPPNKKTSLTPPFKKKII